MNTSLPLPKKPIETPLPAYRCIRCGHFWMTTAGPWEHFSFLTKFCPDCIALLPVQEGIWR